MRRLRVLSVLSFVLILLTSKCFSQNSKTDSSKVKWGFGISSSFYQHYASDVYFGFNSSFSIPMYIAANFKLEPFIGYHNQKYDNKTISETNQSKYTGNHQNLVIGTGLFYYKCFGNTKILFGGNIGIVIHESEYKDEYYSTNMKSNRDGIGYMISPIIGGEYFISDYFSFGAEAHLEWTSLETDGKTKYESASDRTIESSTTRFYTKGVLVLRFYP